MEHPTRTLRMPRSLRTKVTNHAWAERTSASKVIWSQIALLAEKGIDGVELGVVAESEEEVTSTYLIPDNEALNRARVIAAEAEMTLPHIVRRMLAALTSED